MLDFTNPMTKGYCATNLIAEEVQGRKYKSLAPVVVLLAKYGKTHSVYCSREWTNLCQQTFSICGENKKRFLDSWQPILEYLKTQPRYFETGSGMDFIEALADTWLNLNCVAD